MNRSSIKFALGAFALGAALFAWSAGTAKASSVHCTNGATLSADGRTCSDGSIPVFTPDQIRPYTPTQVQPYTPTQVQACGPGRLVSRSNLRVDSAVAGTFAVGQDATVIDRVNVLYSTETVQAVPGADAGILRISGSTYSWTDGGRVTRGTLSLYEPGNCQDGRGMAHFVVRGSLLNRTVYIVRSGSGRITLDNLQSGLYELSGKAL